jgi:hypothetical protein
MSGVLHSFADESAHKSIKGDEQLHLTDYNEYRKRICRPKRAESKAHVKQADDDDCEFRWVFNCFELKHGMHLGLNFLLSFTVLDVGENCVDENNC